MARASSPRICLENPGWVTAVPVPAGSALCICAGPQVYSRTVVTCSTQTAVKAAPWGVRECPCRMGPPGQGGALATREGLWPGMHWPGGCMPPGRARAEAARVSPAHPFHVRSPFHATLSSPTLLWDSPAISMLLEHTRHGSAWCARSMLGHLGAWCPCATTVGVSWGVNRAVGESPQLCAG